MVTWMPGCSALGRLARLALASTDRDLRVQRCANQVGGARGLRGAGRMSGRLPVQDRRHRLGRPSRPSGAGDSRRQVVGQAHGTLQRTPGKRDSLPVAYTATTRTGPVYHGTEGVRTRPPVVHRYHRLFSNGRSKGPRTRRRPALGTMAGQRTGAEPADDGGAGASRIAAALGLTMGGGQAYHWSALLTTWSRGGHVWGARGRCNNKVFLSGLLRTL